MREAGFAAVLFVVALIPRLWAALALAGEPVWDGHYYDFGARRIAMGLGYSDDRTIGEARGARVRIMGVRPREVGSDRLRQLFGHPDSS